MVDVTPGNNDNLDPHEFGSASGGGIDCGCYSSYASFGDDDDNDFLEPTLSMALWARLAHIWVATRGSLRSCTPSSSYTIDCNW